MSNKIQQFEIEGLKREAKALRKSSNLTHSKALDLVARAKGFSNWSQLMKSVENDTFCLEVFNNVCKKFIASLSDSSVYQLCRNGSLWIEIEDILSNSVDIKSLTALGLASDSNVKSYGLQIDALLAVDFNGLAEVFIFQIDAENDEDEDDLQKNLNHGLLLYSPDLGRQELQKCLAYSIEGSYDSLYYRLDDYESAVSDI